MIIIKQEFDYETCFRQFFFYSSWNSAWWKYLTTTLWSGKGDCLKQMKDSYGRPPPVLILSFTTTALQHNVFAMVSCRKNQKGPPPLYEVSRKLWNSRNFTNVNLTVKQHRKLANKEEYTGKWWSSLLFILYFMPALSGTQYRQRPDKTKWSVLRIAVLWTCALHDESFQSIQPTSVQKSLPFMAVA